MATDPLPPPHDDNAPLPELVPPPTPERRDSWAGKLLRLCFVIFCFEIGVFLVVFPWLEYWNTSTVALYAPWLTDLWGSPYLRGALSGLGLANIYISFLEILSLIRGQAESVANDQLK